MGAAEPFGDLGRDTCMWRCLDTSLHKSTAVVVNWLKNSDLTGGFFTQCSTNCAENFRNKYCAFGLKSEPKASMSAVFRRISVSLSRLCVSFFLRFAHWRMQMC